MGPGAFLYVIGLSAVEHLLQGKTQEARGDYGTCEVTKNHSSVEYSPVVLPPARVSCLRVPAPISQDPHCGPTAAPGNQIPSPITGLCMEGPISEVSPPGTWPGEKFGWKMSNFCSHEGMRNSAKIKCPSQLSLDAAGDVVRRD